MSDLSVINPTTLYDAHLNIRNKSETFKLVRDLFELDPYPILLWRFGLDRKNTLRLQRRSRTSKLSSWIHLEIILAWRSCLSLIVSSRNSDVSTVYLRTMFVVNSWCEAPESYNFAVSCPESHYERGPRNIVFHVRKNMNDFRHNT